MTSPQSPATIRHEFLAIDEGLVRLLHVDERDPSRDWIVPLDHPQARDMQLVGNNRVLIGHHHGWSEFDIATGRVVRGFDGYEGVTAVRRQADGSTLIAGVDIAGHAGVVVLIHDEDNQIIHHAVYPGDYVRLLRQTRQGTLLMSCNDRIREADLHGKYLREYPVEGFYHAWKSLRLPDGRMWVTAGYGAFLVELAPDGTPLRRIGTAADLPESHRPFFYAMFQLLENDHIVLANWQGHGEGFGDSGVQLLEFAPDGSLAWSWSDASRISSLQGLLVLDGLDTSRLHDELDGPMRPVN